MTAMRAEDEGTISFRQRVDALILKLGRVCVSPLPGYQQADKGGYSLPLEVGDAQ